MVGEALLLFYGQRYSEPLYTAGTILQGKKSKTLVSPPVSFNFKNGLIDNFTSRMRKRPPPSAGFSCKRNKPDGRKAVSIMIRLSNNGDHMPTKIEKYRRLLLNKAERKTKQHVL